MAKAEKQKTRKIRMQIETGLNRLHELVNKI